MKNISFKNIDVMAKIPGFFGVIDLESKFQFFNESGIQWTGFKSLSELEGKTYADLRCKAAEDYLFFLKQDKQVIKHGRQKFLGYYCYSGDDWKIILGEKTVLKDEHQNPIGIISQFNDYTDSKIIDISKFLISTDNRFGKKHSKKQFCYQIEENEISFNLTKKDLECLFFLLRGKSAKEIAKIFHSSHRTVEQRIDTIKDKLNCPSKSAIIEKSIMLGYLNILPETFFQ